MKRFILIGLLGGLLSTNTGCGLLQAICNYRPCGNGPCGPSMADSCGEGCGPMYGAPRRACVTDCGCGSCGSCDDPCADPCGDTCYGRPWHRGPLSCVFALFMPRTWCGPVCGERYWGDFYSDSPDCHDPCDGCGNYTGGGCQSCGNSGVVSGYSGNSGTCPTCGGGGGFSSNRMPSNTENYVTQSNRTVHPSVKVANQPHRAVRP